MNNLFTAYLQEIGRAGRDGHESLALLYFNMNDIGAHHVKSEVKNFCLLNTCRRKYISEHFGFTFEKIDLPHKCCDICQISCPCDTCLVNAVQKCESFKELTERQQKNDTANQVSTVLMAFFDQQNALHDVTYPELFTGLSKKTADKIDLVVDQIESEMDIKKSFPHLDPKYLSHIWAIISYCKFGSE